MLFCHNKHVLSCTFNKSHFHILQLLVLELLTELQTPKINYFFKINVIDWFFLEISFSWGKITKEMRLLTGNFTLCG